MSVRGWLLFLALTSSVDSALTIFKKSTWYAHNHGEGYVKRNADVGEAHRSLKHERTKRSKRMRRAKRNALLDEHSIKKSQYLDLFTKVEAGCCETEYIHVLWDDSIGADETDVGLVMCLKKCVDSNAGSAIGCGYVMYGWEDSDRCRIVSKRGQCKSVHTKFCSANVKVEQAYAGVHVYAPTELTKSRADRACGVTFLQDWLGYLILNTDVMNYCKDFNSNPHCAQEHFIKNVLFGTDKRKCGVQTLTDTQKAMITCDYVEETDWLCYEMLNPDITHQMKGLKNAERHLMAAKHFLANPGNQCKCARMTSEQKLNHQCLYGEEADWDCYRALNKDVNKECSKTHNNPKDRRACAKRHYQEWVSSGLEKRECKCSAITAPADQERLKKMKTAQKSLETCSYHTEGEWKCYLGLNPDIEFALVKQEACKSSKGLLECAAAHYGSNVLEGPEERPCRCAELAMKRCQYIEETDWDCYLEMNQDVEALCKSPVRSSTLHCARDHYELVAIVGGAEKECACRARNPCETRKGFLRSPLCEDTT